jgi:hypothetical protein
LGIRNLPPDDALLTIKTNPRAKMAVGTDYEIELLSTASIQVLGAAHTHSRGEEEVTGVKRVK